MTTQNVDDTAGGVVLQRLASMARGCPKDYNEAGPSFADFERAESVQALAAALREAGYERLARAVPQGVSWSRQIAYAKSTRELEWAEEEAAQPGWSWNSHAALRDRWERRLMEMCGRPKSARRYGRLRFAGAVIHAFSFAFLGSAVFSAEYPVGWWLLLGWFLFSGIGTWIEVFADGRLKQSAAGRACARNENLSD